MARISGISTGGGEGASLPTGSEGAVLAYQNGTWVGTDAANLKASSGEFTDGVNAASITSDSVTVSDEEGGAAQLLSDSLTMSEVEITKDHLAGLQAATGLSAENPPVLANNPALTDSRPPTSHSHPESDVTFSTSSGHNHDGSNSRTLSGINPQTIVPGGALEVLPARIQTSGDTAFAMTSSSYKFAIGFTPSISVGLNSISQYIKAVSSQGDITYSLCADSLGYQADGALEDQTEFTSIVMTSNSAPSPYAVALINSAGNNDENGSYPAWYALRETPPTFSGSYYVKSTSVPSAGSPLYYTIDAGAGNSFVINAGWFLNANGASTFPTAFTLWGSNVSSPVVNTDADWTQIGGSLTLTDPGQYYARRWSVTNSTAYRWHRWKFTATNGSAVLSFGMRIQAPKTVSCPGTAIASLGTVASGASATSWVRTTFESIQLSAGTRYWLVGTGADNANYSVSHNRVTSTTSSELDDSVECLVTSNGGTTWSRPYMDATKFHSHINLVMNSNQYHAPRLCYGARAHNIISLYSGTAWTSVTLPAMGVALDLDGLTKDTRYRIYLYNNSGTLTLEASQTAAELVDTIEVKTGDHSRRLVGDISPYEFFTSHVGPIDKKNMRRVFNKYNRQPKVIGRTNPYYQISIETFYPILYSTIPVVDQYGQWMRVGNSVWDLQFICGDTLSLAIDFGYGSLDTSVGHLFYALDSVNPGALKMGNLNGASAIANQTAAFTALPGVHQLNLVYCPTTGRIIRYFGTPGNTCAYIFGVYGLIEV